MAITKTQRYFNYIKYTFLVIVAVLAFFDGLSSSIDFISLRIAIWGTITLIIIGVIGLLIIKRFPVLWKLPNGGPVVKIKAMGTFFPLTLIALLFSLWVPVLMKKLVLVSDNDETTLSEEFLEFHDRFYIDSSYQMGHILFPLGGLPAELTNPDLINGRFEWRKEDWRMIREISNDLVSKEIVAKEGRTVWEKWTWKADSTTSFKIFVKLYQEWYLNFYVISSFCEKNTTESFVNFYERFHDDPDYQIAHIIFPLEGLPDWADSSTILNNDFRWSRKDWVIQKAFDISRSTFDMELIPINNCFIIERIIHKSEKYGMQRRFALLGDEWYLIYYAGLNRIK